MRKIKRNLLSALAGAACFLLLTGFDSDLSVEELLSRTLDAVSSQTETSTDLNVEMDFALSLPQYDTTFSITGNGDFTGAVTTSPLAMRLEGTLELSYLDSPMDLPVCIYLLPKEDGTLSLTYKISLPGNDGSQQWQKLTLTATQSEALKKILLSGMNTSLLTLPFSYQLEKESVRVGEAECYQLHAGISWDDLWLILRPWLDQSGAGLSASDADLAGALLSGLAFNLETDVRADDSLIAAMHLDLDGSDFTNLLSLLSGQLGTDSEGNPIEASFHVNKLEANASFRYGEEVEIALPEEAENLPEE